MSTNSGICPICGAPLPPRKRKYCSDECRKAQNGKDVPSAKSCKICGAPLPPRHTSYCSDECASLGNKIYQHEFRQQRAGRTVTPMHFTCIVCGKPLPPRHKKFCSRECQQLAAKRRAAPATPACCIICGAPLPPRHKKFCNDCRQKYKSSYSLALALMSPDEQTAFRAQIAQRRAEKLAAMSPEELAKHRRDESIYVQNRQKQKLAAMTSEERESFMQAQKQRTHDRYVQRLASMSPEELKEYRERRNAASRRYHARKKSQK